MPQSVQQAPLQAVAAAGAVTHPSGSSRRSASLQNRPARRCWGSAPRQSCASSPPHLLAALPLSIREQRSTPLLEAAAGTSGALGVLARARFREGLHDCCGGSPHVKTAGARPFFSPLHSSAVGSRCLALDSTSTRRRVPWLTLSPGQNRPGPFRPARPWQGRGARRQRSLDATAVRADLCPASLVLSCFVLCPAAAPLSC